MSEISNRQQIQKNEKIHGTRMSSVGISNRI